MSAAWLAVIGLSGVIVVAAAIVVFALTWASIDKEVSRSVMSRAANTSGIGMT